MFFGILIYFFGAVMYLLYIRFFGATEIAEFKLALVGFKSIAVGLVFVFISFKLLSIIWSRRVKVNKKEIDKIGN